MRFRKRPLSVEHGGQRLALQVLHDQIRLAVEGVVPVHHVDDVGVMEGRQDLGFATKTVQKVAPIPQLHMQHFQRKASRQPGV